MATEQVLEVSIRRHIIESERPFASMLDGIFGGISQPDIGLARCSPTNRRSRADRNVPLRRRLMAAAICHTGAYSAMSGTRRAFRG